MFVKYKMKAKKLLFYTSLITGLFFSAGGYASTITKTGCGLGSAVYMDKLGTSNFWGTPMEVYNQNGTSYSYDWSNSSQCNSVNENSRVNAGGQCWVNTYLNPNDNSSGVQWGTKMTVTINICEVPFDSKTWVLIVISGGFGYFILRNRMV
ncbi:hypothetical protein D9M68_549220 [compost metagenome]